MLYSTASFAYQRKLTGFMPFLRDRLNTHLNSPGKVKVRGGRNAVLCHPAPPPTPSTYQCGAGPSGVSHVWPCALPEPFLTAMRDNDVSADLLSAACGGA